MDDFKELSIKEVATIARSTARDFHLNPVCDLSANPNQPVVVDVNESDRTIRLEIHVTYEQTARKYYTALCEQLENSNFKAGLPDRKKYHNTHCWTVMIYDISDRRLYHVNPNFR